MRLVEGIKKEIPVFHTRATRKEFYRLYGLILPKSKLHILRSIYHSLIGDQSGARTTAEEKMDQRVSEALMMEDPEIIMDLRQLNKNGKDSFGVF